MSCVQSFKFLLYITKACYFNVSPLSTSHVIICSSLACVTPEESFFEWTSLKIESIFQPFCFFTIIHSCDMKTQYLNSWPVFMNNRWQQSMCMCLSSSAIIWAFVNENAFLILSNAANLAHYVISILSRKACFLYDVNVKYKQRFQGLKTSVSGMLSFFINLHVDNHADDTIIARLNRNTFIIYKFCVFVHGNLFLLRLNFNK